MTFKERKNRLDALKESLLADDLEAVWLDSFALGKIGRKIRQGIITDSETFSYAWDIAKPYMQGWIDIGYAGLDV